METNPLLLVLIGTGITFLSTVLGASFVLFFKKDINPTIQKLFLGFAAGVMIAASVWSLLIPAIELAETQGKVAWTRVSVGFLAGGFFLWLLDSLLPHLHPGSKTPEGLPTSWRRSTMLLLALTLHNIPEGMAVGLSFGFSGAVEEGFSLASAFALAIGIGLQNIPEGMAVAMPLKQASGSRFKAFLYGSLSGIVEPIAGILVVFLAGSSFGFMPWLLAFAAGAMIYVVVEELIPSFHEGEHSNMGTIGVMIGFVLMMILDISL
ncbi:MAG TPA: ZIP family metal transporter [Bacteroidales bacterium]|nr:ZIP family metal transporter [Bacteroidales bacterium]